jgi:hypothetical protein
VSCEVAGLSPKNPRTKKAKPGGSKDHKVVQRSLSDASRITKGVPDKIKIAMADAIMAFSDMEMSAEVFRTLPPAASSERANDRRSMVRD